MRMIHVLRKPLSEGTVAANTLKHGTGGLNIDASRLASPGEVIETHSRSPEASAKKNRPVYGEYGPLKTHQTEGQKLGRWPANVILQHSDGCRREGKESVANWVCEPGCPVARLDTQSLAGGMHSAGASRPSGQSLMNPGDGGMFNLAGHESNGARFGDKGGASRFYKQVGGKSDG